MKRPQFGLRLLLLSLALLATCLAWRQAIRQRDRADREAEIRNLQTQLAVQERYRERYANWNPPNPASPEATAMSPEIELQISTLQNRLEALKP